MIVRVSHGHADWHGRVLGLTAPSGRFLRGKLLRSGMGELFTRPFLAQFVARWADRRGIEHVQKVTPGGQRPWHAARRRLPTGFHIWVLLCGLLILWLLSAPERTMLHRRLAVAFVTFLYFVAAAEFGLSVRRQELPPEVIRGVRWVMLAMLLNGFGGLIVLMYALFDPKNTSAFNLSDLLFLGTYPALLTGLVSMPRVERSSISLGRMAVDGAVFVAGVGLPLWFFAVGPGLRAASGFEALMDVVYPLVTFGGISVLNVVLLTRKPLPSRGAFRLLVCRQHKLAGGPRVPAGHRPGLRGQGTDQLDQHLQHALDRRLPPRGAENQERPALAAAAHTARGLEPASDGDHHRGERLAGPFCGKGSSRPGVDLADLLDPAALFVLLSVRETYFIRDSEQWMSAEIERKSRARFEAVVRNSSDVIMVVDSGLVIRFASPASATALGKAPDAVAGQELLSLVHPEDLQKGSEFLGRVLAPYKAHPPWYGGFATRTAPSGSLRRREEPRARVRRGPARDPLERHHRPRLP